MRYQSVLLFFFFLSFTIKKVRKSCKTSASKSRVLMYQLSVVLAVLSIALAAVSVQGELELVLVQLVHRHGARSALPPVNASIVCPRGCGLLNLQGKDMLLHTGSYLAARYNGSRPEISPAPFFATATYPSGTTYDVREVYSRSTSLSRTLQSGAGLLKGLFPNASEYFPAIHTVEFMQDELLLVDVIPTYHIYQSLQMPQLSQRLAEFAEPMFPQAAFSQMAQDFHMEGLCSDAGNYITCILGMQDIAATYNSLGVLNAISTTAAQYFEQLNLCRRTWNSYFFPFNASDPVQRQRGSLGQNLAQRMLSNMRAAMKPANDSATLGKKLMHYSAHDTTVMPFVATLGNNHLMLPPFGQLYLLDLMRNTTDGTYHVRAAQSVPGQEPDTLSNISESVLPLYCMKEGTNVVYTVTSITGTCPFDDFERFINASLPLSPAGLCYLEPAVLAQIECDTTGVAPLANSTCFFYRNYCPQYSCPPGSVVSPVDSSCVALTLSSSDQMTSGVVGGVAVGTLLGGVLVGLLLSKLRGQQYSKYTEIGKESS